MAMTIRGEYWISKGHVDFADGDIGDKNHEGIATEHIFYHFADSIRNYAEELGVEANFDSYDEIDIEAISNVMWEIYEKLIANGEKEPDKVILKNLNTNQDVLQVLYGKGDSRLCVMKYEGWIAVRENNIDVFGFDENKRKSLLNGLYEILDQEGIEEDVSPENLEFSIHDFKTNRASYVTLADIENPNHFIRPKQIIQNTYNKSFGTKDKEENFVKNSKSISSPWNLAAQQAKIIGPGQNLWRGTSENFSSFFEWINSNDRLF